MSITAEVLRCIWCDCRQPNRTALAEHEEAHWEADRLMRLREVRPSAAVTAERFEAAVALGNATVEGH